MKRSSHRRLIGFLLSAFVILNIVIAIGVLDTFPFRELETDSLGLRISWLVRAAVYLSVALFAVQLLSAIILLIGGRLSRPFGLIASVIATLGGFSLPVGIYGFWLLASKETDGDRKLQQTSDDVRN